MESYYIVFILFWLCVLYFNFREIKYANKLQSASNNKKLIYWTQAVLFIGIFVRTISLSFPEGVGVDEAIGGYDTWCLANYGVDNHLNSYPVYFRSWGSGQSALYGYFALPFIKLFGLSVPVFRLPMALWSSIAMIIFYWSMRKTQKSQLFIFVITLFIAICPWHIMMSRWALDCNLCPNFVLIGMSFIIILVNNNLSSKKSFLYLILAFTFFALAAYSYGVSWFMLPLFFVLLIWYLLKQKKATITQLSICGIWLGFILIPLILFAIVLFFHGEQFQLGPITITELKAGRHHATTLLGTDEPFLAILSYGKMAARLIFLGSDRLVWNSFYFWGQFFNLLGIPFIVYYFYNYKKTKFITSTDKIFLIWLISTLPILILVEPNVNHWNLLWFPLVYFVARGIYLFIEKYPKIRLITFIIIGCLGIGFCTKYYTRYSSKRYTGFTRGVEEVVSYTSNLDLDKIYYSNEVAFVTVLFFEPISPYEYNKIKKSSMGGVIEHFDYGKYTFHLPQEIIPKSKTAYIIKNNEIRDINKNEFQMYKGKYYTILWNE